MGIAGHIRPDGDCVGSCMALYLYVTEHFPEIDVRIYLDHPKPVFSHIDRIGDIRTETDGDREFDLFVTLSLIHILQEPFWQGRQRACDH